MAIEITMTGSGTVGDILNWSAQEDSTPVSIADSSGSTGQVSVTAATTELSEFIVDNSATSAHETLGSVQGNISGVNVSNATTNFAINTPLALLNVDATMPPIGPVPLSQVFSTYVFTIAPALSVDFQATLNPDRVYRGWRGNGWDFLKQLCAANNVEIAVSGSTIIVRDVGAATFALEDFTPSPSLSLNTQSSGRSVEVFYDQAQAVLTTVPNTYNYSTNPSFESNITDWSATMSIGTFDTAFQRNNDPLPPFVGAWKGFVGMRDLNTASGFPGPAARLHEYVGRVNHRINGLSVLEDGSPYTFSVRVYTPTAPVKSGLSGNFVSPSAALVVSWYNSSNVLLSTSVGSTSTLSNTPFAWTPISLSSSKPTGTSYAIMGVEFSRSFLDANTGTTISQFYMDGAMVTTGSTPYFDGSSPGASWTGTVNNSVSTKPSPGNVSFYDAYADDNAIYSVGVGETNVITIPTDNYPLTLVPPTQTMTTPLQLGSYIISGSNGLPVTPGEWQAFGGSVSVAVGSDPGSIILTLVGPRSAVSVPGPYSLSVTDGDKTYGALNIVGTGVVTNKQKLTLLTGADPLKTTQLIASSTDSPFINTLADAYDRGVWVSVEASGPSVNLTVEVPTAQLAGFGLTAGSLISYRGSMYRIRNVSISNASANITATWHVLQGAVESLWSGKTAGQYDALWAGYDAQDAQIKPLRVV